MCGGDGEKGGGADWAESAREADDHLCEAVCRPEERRIGRSGADEHEVDAWVIVSVSSTNRKMFPVRGE